MIDSLKVGKRAFTTAVAAATILWSVGISSFVAPMTARAASAGDVVRGTTLSTLYYMGSDGSRYAFPNEKTYFSWYSDFSDVTTLSDSALAAIPLAGNVVYRPGTRWIKIQSDPKTYVVTTEGEIRWIESEEVASGLAGSDWNTMIDDVPDTFFVDYTVGTSLTDAGDAFEGALVSVGGSNYVVWDGEKREVSSAGFTANGFQTRNVLDGASIDLSGLSSGSEVTAEVTALTDTAQLGGVTVTGGLSVSLASDTPASATIPASASSVAFTKVKLMASSGSADVSQMVFHLGGIGSTGNLSDAYLYEGSARLTDGRSINSARNVTFSGLDLSLDEGDSTYVTVKADISTSPTGGDTASFALSEAGSVTSTATVSGSFPVTGNTMTFSATDAGTLTITAGTTPSDPTIGEDEAEIAEIDLEATDEDAWLETIAFNVDNSNDHSNYELWDGSDKLATGVVSGDLVTFELSDAFFVEEGNTETLNVTANIGGESGDDVVTYIEAPADVVAMGGDYGFNLAVDVSGYDTTGEGTTVTIQGGDLTFAFNGPTSDDVVIDGNDVTFMEFSLTASNWTEVKNVDVVVSDTGEDNDDDDDTGLKGDDGATDYANLEDIAIRESDGSVWMGSMELGFDDADSDTSQTLSFDDNQILQAGESLDLMVTADISPDAVANEAYHVEIDMSGVDAEDANGDTLTDVVPSSDLIGNDMTVTDSSLAVTLSRPPSTGTYVKGATNVSVAGFMFEAGDASDVLVNEAIFYVQGDEDATWSDESDIVEKDYVSSCSVYDNESGALVDGPVSPDTDSSITFDSMDWTIQAGESSKLLLKCSFSNQNSNNDNDAYVFYIESETDIDAEDADGETVDVGTISDANGNDPTGAESVIITVSTGGSMTVSASGSTPSSTIILGSSTGVNVSKVKFAASNQAFVVNTFSMYNCVGWYNDTDADCTGAGEALGADDATAAVKLSYTDSEGATATDTGYLSNNIVTFDNLDLYVPADSSTTVTVTVDTNSVSASTATAGDQIQLNFIDDNFDADGVGSSNSLTEASAGIVDVADFNTMTLHKTKPTVSLASGSPSGAGSPGLSEVFRFNVAADSRGYVTLNQVAFKVTATDDAGDGDAADGWADADAANLADDAKWELYDADDTSTKLDLNGWTFIGIDGDTTPGADDDLTYAVLDFTAADEGSQEIGAGETVTYVLRVDTTGASTSADDSFRIDIADQDETAALGTALDTLVWEDDSDTTDFDGDLVRSLPVTGGTIQY